MTDPVERLRRPQYSPGTQSLTDEAADEIERLRAEIIELQTEADLSWKASLAMDRLLTQTVNILMGPPPVGKSWGWAGIPERTQAVMDRLDAYDAEKSAQVPRGA